VRLHFPLEVCRRRLPFQTDSRDAAAASWICVSTCFEWPNGLASFLENTCKSHKNLFQCYGLSAARPKCNHHANGRHSTCVNLGCDAKRWKIYVDLRTNLIKTEVSASQRKCMQGLAKRSRKKSQLGNGKRVLTPLDVCFKLFFMGSFLCVIFNTLCKLIQCLLRGCSPQFITGISVELRQPFSGAP